MQCLGFDRIVGSLGPKTKLSFKADKGKVDISTSKIAAIAYDALTLDLGKGVTLKLMLIPLAANSRMPGELEYYR
ncbi:MAG: hypothetical protein FVQ82_08565 [Planctomycetes bacterium]|nr:hypothetical protein [Planctomycetota bacterium]